MVMTVKEIADKFPGTVRHFKEKTPIIYQGEVPRCGFYLKKGIVKVYNLHANGNEQILRFYGPGDFFPLPWLYGQVATEFYYYEAVENCEVISVTKQDVADVIKKDPALSQYIFDAMLSDQTALNLRIISLEQPRANEKLEYTLYYLMFRYGKHVGDEIYVINMSLTHITLANLVGLTRETITMEMNKLKKKGIISYAKKIYKVDRRKLEHAIGEENFSGILG
jgi:CRP/FNR family transcriptional regulator